VTVKDWLTDGTTEINGSNITTGSITLSTVNGGSGSIQSADYSAGSDGWKINSAGDAEFNDVSIRGTLKACIVNGGDSLIVYGNVKFADSAAATEYFIVDDQYIGAYFDSNRVITIACDVDQLSPINIILPATATTSDSSALNVESCVADRACANFYLSNSSATSPAVIISTNNATQTALKILGGVLSCNNIGCGNLNCNGDIDCDNISCIYDIDCDNLNCDGDIDCDDINCNDINLDSTGDISFDGVHLYRSGSDLYWNGTKLN
jgi:hypothetical protein